MLLDAYSGNLIMGNGGGGDYYFSFFERGGGGWFGWKLFEVIFGMVHGDTTIENLYLTNKKIYCSRKSYAFNGYRDFSVQTDSQHKKINLHSVIKSIVRF